MENETLEKLCKERTAIKSLLSIDYERYKILETRSCEIKTIINSRYSEFCNASAIFSLCDLKLAEKITNKTKEILNELKNNL